MRFSWLNPKRWIAAIWRAILHDLGLQTRAERIAAAEKRVLDGMKAEALNARYPEEGDAPFGPGVTVADIVELLRARGDKRTAESGFARTTLDGRRTFTIWWSNGRRVRYSLRRVGHGFRLDIDSVSPQSQWEDRQP